MKGNFRFIITFLKIIEQIKDRFNIPYEIDFSDGQFRLTLGAQLMNLMQNLYKRSLPSKRRDFNVWSQDDAESNVLRFLTPNLLHALIKKMKPEHLTNILKLKDVNIIYNLMKKWNIDKMPDLYYNKFYNPPNFLGKFPS